MVALLISESPFTKSTLLRAHSSPIPFFFLHLPPVEESAISASSSSLGTLGAAMCNPALCGSRGLLKGQMEVRWERPLMGQEGSGRPALWWRGERLQSRILDVDKGTDILVEDKVSDT
ncbi:hypothetical protein CPC08DRAFT_715015 [Agrocybe pediades]|nr:hypothetical protein CPC08DRAFT_715015 [Agrocybe pediades]